MAMGSFSEGQPRKFIFNGIDLTEYLRKIEIISNEAHTVREAAALEARRHLLTMEEMMKSINTVHDFISTCAYAREIRDKENE